MAYVRKRGNQLAIVHGIRDPETKKVEQQILFTLYSKAEALEAVGKPKPESAGRFQRLLERRYSQIHFDWKELRLGIEANLDGLPESYDYQSTRLRGRFRDDLKAFARQVVLTDPQHLTSSSQLLDSHRLELEYVRELISWRLSEPAAEPNQWNGDNDFYWRFAVRDADVPPDVEEHASGYYERGDYSRAKVAFQLLTETFEDYAEGHNYLGLIALNEGRPADAAPHFEKTMEVGRRLFPKRIAKGSWWTDHSTRPFMRGLRNLALALNQAERYPDALAACDRLERECHDAVTAAAHRASAYLNLGRWQQALDAALFIHQISPSESLVAALAAHELGRLDDARAWFIHAALNAPRTVAMVLGVRMPKPEDSEEVRDHNGGVALTGALPAYLRGRTGLSRRFFADLWKSQALAEWRRELAEATRRWREDRKGTSRDAFDRMNELRSLAFAESCLAPRQVGATRSAPKQVGRVPGGSRAGRGEFVH